MSDRTYGDVIQERIDYKNREIDRLETEVSLLHELREDMDGISIQEKQEETHQEKCKEMIDSPSPFEIVTHEELREINKILSVRATKEAEGE